MRVLASICGAAILVGLFFIVFSQIIPSTESKVPNIFFVEIDVELAFDKYEFTWDEAKSTIAVTKYWKGKPVLTVTNELSVQQDALLKYFYSKLDYTVIQPNAPTSTDGSWWHITNHGHSFSIRNPDYNIEQRNLYHLNKLVKNIKKFSNIKKYGVANT